MKQALRWSLRRIRRNPMDSITMVLTLAIGVGAVTAVFSVYEAVVARAMPYANPDELVRVWQDNRLKGDPKSRVSYPNLADWRAQSSSFEELAGFGNLLTSLRGQGEPVQVAGGRVTANFFSTLGVMPVAGRGFLPEDEMPESPDVVVLSEGLWQRRYGRDLGLLGETIGLDGSPHTVVGVMPSTFDLPRKAQLWVPQEVTPEFRSARDSHWFEVVGRLEAGASLASARTEMGRIASVLEEEYPDSNRGQGATLVPLREEVLGNVDTTVLILAAGAGLVLLIACANVGNLVLARTVGRRRELGISTAMGASRADQMGQNLMEYLLVALLGGLLGFLLARWSLGLLVAVHPAALPRLDETRWNWVVFAFSLGVASSIGLTLGAVATFRATSFEAAALLREEAQAGSKGLRRSGVRNVLVLVAVSLAFLLLTTGGLFLQSARRLQAVDLGFTTEKLLALKISLPRDTYPDGPSKAEFFRTAVQRLERLPGVVRADAASSMPFGQILAIIPFQIESYEPTTSSLAAVAAVTPSYFRSVGAPIQSGRPFTDRDTEDFENVAIVNETLAQLFPPDVDPVGRRIAYWDPSFGDTMPEHGVDWHTVVGVVGDMRRQGPDAPVVPEIYVPAAQTQYRTMNLVLATSNDPSDLIPASKAAIHGIDPDLPILRIATVDEMYRAAVARRRFSFLLTAFLSVVGVCLASGGIYGLVSYVVRESTPAMAVRIALGASPRTVFGLVLSRGFALIAGGLVLGFIGYSLVVRTLGSALRSLLFEVDLLNPGLGLTVALLLTAVGTAAALVPAWRATRLNPAALLDTERSWN